MKNYFEKFKALSKTKQIVIVIIILAILVALFGDDKKSSYRSNESSYKSTTPDFVCKNCGGNSFRYHETVTDMKVCNSCGVGQ
jgi:ribosomal protein L37E